MYLHSKRSIKAALDIAFLFYYYNDISNNSLNIGTIIMLYKDNKLRYVLPKRDQMFLIK